MLVETAHFHPRLKGRGVMTFEDLMTIPFGQRGHHFILAAMFVSAYGAMVAYLLIIKDTVPVVIGLEDEPGSGSFIERELVMVISSLVIILPLSLQRDMSALAFTSFLSVVADTFLVLFIAAFSPIKETVGNAGGLGQVLKTSIVNPGFFIGFGVLTIAMTCQHSAFIVSGSLANLTSSRWATVTFQSLTLSCILCAILGITGYLGFLDDTQGDILNNFEPDTMQATAARALLAITMFCTYPMEAFVARHVLIKLFFDGDMDGNENETALSSEYSSGQTPSQGFFSRRFKWTCYIYLSTLVPALFLDDLGPVLSLTGAIGGCSLAYIGPGLMYIGVNGDDFLAFIANYLDDRKRGATPSGVGELPIEGDANANMQTSEFVIPAGAKPWWWYPALMPCWVRVATVGSLGTKECLARLEAEHGPPSGEDVQSETIGPCKRDYFISIFFVSFGFVALAAGILSNLFVQINGIFYTPT
jgi:sodium-coupled neutral amino acid transporter 11